MFHVEIYAIQHHIQIIKQENLDLFEVTGIKLSIKMKVDLLAGVEK